MLLSLFAVAVALGSEGTPCAVVARHQLLTGSSIDCCESCSLGWLRTSSWITSSVKTMSVDSNSEIVQLDARGSGDLTLHSSDSIFDTLATADSKVLTRPCGECVSYDHCLNRGGHVNTWHRTCTRL